MRVTHNHAKIKIIRIIRILLLSDDKQAFEHVYEK